MSSQGPAVTVDDIGLLPGRRMPKALRSTLWFLLILAFLVLMWEGYKVVWKATEGTIPVVGWEWLVDGDNLEMPHVWDVVSEFFEPAQRGNSTILLVVLLEASLFTIREAALGFVIGAAFGFGIGVLFARSALAERAFMPYVVASQTVPILAIAPMVVIWGRQLAIPQWVSVSIIAAYLTFFPVAINTLRGLRSPPATATELMRSYAASRNEVLWKLQVPAAVPFIFTALKVSAAASIIGAIVGELPAGFRSGLARQLLLFSQQFTSRPERLYAAVLISALTGIVVVAAVSLAERTLLPPTRRLAE